MSIYQAARIIAAAMLVLALFEMPGAFYSALRLVVFVAAILEIVQIQKGSLTEGKKTGWTLAFAAIAIIFNPIMPLEMAREEWAWFNVAGGGIFLLSQCGTFFTATFKNLASDEALISATRVILFWMVVLGLCIGGLILIAQCGEEAGKKRRSEERREKLHLRL